ncbi:hypothetical protein COUCH_31310 [Couchioplanes caeruleus]|uniref:hypothetical protein n=1 Tax=Couchioplanes caeruleus TaxID=56438 RepID=UPI0020C006BB|nr:hypothetical protein [Couchioplanes caeruleus]UQU63465.1 hypothetical protein COUCH_31310 [Couchioplanes caeruleus]
MRLRAFVILVLAPVLLIAAGVGVWYVVTQKEGRYDMAPRACPKIEPVVDELGVPYELRPAGKPGICDLRLPEGHPQYTDAPKITVSFSEPVRDIAGAKQLMSDIGSRPGMTPLAGVGDDAYVQDRDFYVRVSNLVVTITVQPDRTSTPDQVKAFTVALADRL